MDKKLRLVRNLIEKRSARRQEGLFVVEGPHLVQAAAGRIKFIIYTENLLLVQQLESQGIDCIKVTNKEYATLTGVATPQGILAVVKEQANKLNDMLKEEKTLIVYCCGIQDPGNLGTIIRSAAAFGATGLVLSKGTVDLYNPKVIRATMGALFQLPIMTSPDDGKTLKQLKENDVKIVATSVREGKACYQAELNKPLALVIGNEAAGLPKDIVKLADELVTIPMTGPTESLNAGVAAAILLYEATRQRDN